MYKSETQLRVRYAETDQMNVVYYGNYAQYFEVGRVESIRQLGYTYKMLEANGVIMPVVEMNVRYLRPATYDELLTIRSQIRELPQGYQMEFYQEVYNEQEKLLAIMQSTANALVKAGKIKPVELSPHWLANDQPEVPKDRGLPTWAKIGAFGGLGLVMITYLIMFLMSSMYLKEAVDKLQR